jgi:hypothetical protein
MKWKQGIGIFAVLIILSCLCISVVSAHRMHVVHKINEAEEEIRARG